MTPPPLGSRWMCPTLHCVYRVESIEPAWTGFARCLTEGAVPPWHRLIPLDWFTDGYLLPMPVERQVPA